jgi:hypothetical protein
MFSYSDKKVFIINGKGGSGKDTFVENVNKYVSSDNYSSVESIKEVACLLGWQGDKSDKSRRFLSDLKELSSKYNDMPFQDIIKYLNYFLVNMYNEDELSFIHVREPEEIKRLVDFCEDNNIEVHTIYVHNANLSNRTYNNNADDNVDSYAYEYIIDNSGDLKHLDDEVRAFLKWFKIRPFIREEYKTIDGDN